MSLHNPEAIRHMERLNMLGDCWAAVADLMIPEKDLHIVDRDRLAALLGFLQQEYNAARKALYNS